MTKSRVHIRRAYERNRSSFSTSSPSLTRQADKQSCDVNHILKRYEKDGVLSHVRSDPGSYLDVASIGADDYHASLNKVISAGQAFDALPSAVREFYRNDPALFLYAIETGTLDPSLYEALGITPHAEQKPPQGASGRGGDGDRQGDNAPGGTSGPAAKQQSESNGKS